MFLPSPVPPRPHMETTGRADAQKVNFRSMPKAPHPSPTSQQWKLLSPRDREDREAELRKLIAEARRDEHKDKRREKEHAAELHEMLVRIERAKSEIIFSNNFGKNEVIDAFVRATEAIKRYVEICLKTSPLIHEKKSGLASNKDRSLSSQCGKVIDENA